MERDFIVITGASGRTGTAVAMALLGRGHRVRVLGRSADRLQPFAARGAEPFVTDPMDEAGLTRALAGARAAYVMLQPNYIKDSRDFRAFQVRLVAAIGTAVERSGIGHVVSLSSWGAAKADGTGPVAGLHELEQRLDRIEGLNALHLRVGYFMENTLSQAETIRARGTAAGPFRPDIKMPMIATRNVGDAAAEALVALDFEGKQARELLGQRDLSMSEAAAVIGEAIGRPGLAYVQDPEERVRAELLAAGFSPNVVGLVLEVASSINSGHLRALEPRSARNTTATSFEAFVSEEFVPLFAQSG